MTNVLAILALSAVTSLPIINDNYPKARAAAIEKHVPVFVEVWASW